MNLKHLKLTNGDEIVCEVLDSNEEMAEAVIRNAMRIVAIDDFENNVGITHLNRGCHFKMILKN